MDEQKPAAAPFTRHDGRDVIDLIAAYPLAWVSAGIGAPASLLPLLPDLDDAGRLTGLIGHLALHNPLVGALTADARADIAFTGPQGYISPEIVSQPGWAPTWNYAQARIVGTVTFDAQGGDAALALLVERMEADRPQPWRVADMGARYDRLRAGIIAFRVRITRVDARFKLGQDESPDTLAEILARHPNDALVKWMRRMNAARLEMAVPPGA